MSLTAQSQNENFVIEYGVAYNGITIDTASIENEFIINDVIKSDRAAKKLLKDDITLLTLKYNANIKEVTVRKVDMMTVDEHKQINMAMVGIEDFNHNIENKIISLIESDKDFFVDKISWRIHDEYKNILGFKCQRATTTYSLPNGIDREVVAWFANNIPVQTGPYKLLGLPGLILEIDTPTKRKIYAKNIKFN